MLRLPLICLHLHNNAFACLLTYHCALRYSLINCDVSVIHYKKATLMISKFARPLVAIKVL